MKVIILLIIIFFVLIFFRVIHKMKKSKNLKNKKDKVVDLEKDPKTNEYKPKD
tara:strand:- start:392 stop:550 length:159 start_codon:yes stop_codon:yes gene_type:complete